MNQTAPHQTATDVTATSSADGDLSTCARTAAPVVDVTDKPSPPGGDRPGGAAHPARRHRRLASGDLPKGEALATARIAGIMGAKRTADLIPLCHPLPLSGVELDLAPRGDRVEITARVRTRGVTGVEMEALTAASVAALTVYDMIKAVDHLARIDGIEVLAKSGGKSGDWHRRPTDAPEASDVKGED